MSLGYVLGVILIVYLVAMFFAPFLQTGYGYGGGGLLLVVVLVVLLAGRNRTL